MFRIFTLLADWICYSLADLPAENSWVQSLHFFIEDTAKIFTLLAFMIFVIGFFRAGLNAEKVRSRLQGRRRITGYLAAAAFGSVTPFCSCSSIPLFLGFTSARIPLGITMAFLITSPMINEVAVVLLGSMLGIRFLILYVVIGLAAGILGGAFLDTIGAEKYLTPLGSSFAAGKAEQGSDGSGASGSSISDSGAAGAEAARPNFSERISFAAGETGNILKRIWKWVFIGVGAGAVIHGLVPENFIARHLGSGQWWSVPAAVLLGIPLYGGAAGTIPVIQSLISKGLPAGTAAVFMMSVVAVSFPEFVLLRQVMKPRLLLIFFSMLLVFFTLAGWILNLAL